MRRVMQRSAWKRRRATYVPSNSINSKSVKLPDPANPFDFVVFGASSLDPIVWGGDKEEKSRRPRICLCFVREFSRSIAGCWPRWAIFREMLCSRL